MLQVQPHDAYLDPSCRTLRRLLGEIHPGPNDAGHRRLVIVDAPPSPALRAAVVVLCADPLLETALPDRDRPDGHGWVIDVLLRPGVTDAEGASLADALRRDGFAVAGARTGHRYLLPADLAADEVDAIARLLANPVVEQVARYRGANPPPPQRWAAAFVPAAAPSGIVETVAVRGLADRGLLAVSAERLLALPVEDLRAVRDHFATLDRDPTDVELETIAQTWSEHCAHRTFKATICHREPGADPIEIDGLLRTYIVAATEAVGRPWVLSAFADNAGVVAFDRRWALAFKVETHNHPSALEPFGGANTGVGGVVRDVLGVSADPIANTDVLCFGPPALPPADLPPGALHPRRVLAGVVAGVADYGNKMGIPTVDGAVLFDPAYAANPLVFCGTVGLTPRGAHPGGPHPGDLVVVAGGRTGRDGLHGATFSSDVLDAGATAALGTVVQIGDPIVEKRLADALPTARDGSLYRAITDCGAGGLSSAVGEMASELGADVELALVPLKDPGLRPWEIWLSEAQERMVLAVPPASWDRLRDVFAAEGVEATSIGQFTGDGRLLVRFRDRLVADLDGAFLHRGMPVRRLDSVWSGPPPEADPAPGRRSHPTTDLGDLLLEALADLDVASKEPIVRRYDHEVQGRTLGKPFVGPRDLGPADAAVLQPLSDSRRGIAVGCGINPRYGRVDPYAMALLAVDEALRNVVAVGGDPDRTAILDNFCWGNPNRPDRLGGLVRAARGCHDAAVGFRLPFISGKDSLNNEYRAADGTTHAIPGTLLISALAIVPDLDRVVSMDLKAVGNTLFLVGLTDDDLGGSLLLKLRGRLGDRAPRLDPRAGRATVRRLHRAIRGGLVQGCHDLSEGGLGVAIGEMAIAAGLGAEIGLRRLPRSPAPLDDETLLFSESPTRFLVEVAPADIPAFERLLRGRPCAMVGRVLAEPRLRVLGARGETVVDAAVEALARAWREPLAEVMA